MKGASMVSDIYEMKTMGKTFGIFFICLNETKLWCTPIE